MTVVPSAPESVRSLLTVPSHGTQPTNPRPAELSANQAAKLSKLVAHFGARGFVLPGTLEELRARGRAKRGVELTEWEKCSLLNREALVRCLRADKWDIEKCKARVEETIVWRRDCCCDAVEFSDEEDALREEAATGKMFVLGFDNFARPIVHMRPRHQNSSVSPKRLQFAFWVIDRAVDLMPPGVESVLILIDLAGPQESPSVKQQRDFVKTLSAHYCERLGQALVINMPTVFVWFLKLLKPVIDPVTFAKAVFDKPDPLAVAPAEQLDAPVGGTSGYDFDIETYWPALVDECMRRRRDRLLKWTRAGKSVGESELDEPSSTSIVPALSDSSLAPSLNTRASPSTQPTSLGPSICSHANSSVGPDATPIALVS